MKLILLRGPSGTGKSTIAAALALKAAQEHANGAKLCTLTFSFHETDQFFVDENGVYRFDANLLTKAHAWNQQEVRVQMLCETQLVIVSNTFIKHWEMKHCLDLANELGYEVEIIRTPGPWDAEVLFKRNKHGVPMDVIKRHITSYQPHADEREWTDLSVFK